MNAWEPWLYLACGLLLGIGETIAWRQRNGRTVSAYVRRLPLVGRVAVIVGLLALAAHFAGLI